MEEVIDEVKEEVKPKKAKKRRGPDSCECDSVPTPKHFSLPTVKNDATLVGTYCEKCYSILAWGRVENEKPEQEEKPKAIKKEKVSKDEYVVPEITHAATTISMGYKNAPFTITPEQIKEEVQTEVREKLAEAGLSEPTVLTGLFPIIGVNPVKDKPDHQSFLCAHNGLPFNVIVASTVEKVELNISKPHRVVGKMAELEYTSVDTKGIPQDPKILAVKTKEA